MVYVLHSVNDDSTPDNSVPYLHQSARKVVVASAGASHAAALELSESCFHNWERVNRVDSHSQTGGVPTFLQREGVFAEKGARFRGKCGLGPSPPTPGPSGGGGRRGPIYRENEPPFRRKRLRVLIVSQTRSLGMFLVSALKQPRHRKRTNLGNPPKNGWTSSNREAPSVWSPPPPRLLAALDTTENTSPPPQSHGAFPTTSSVKLLDISALTWWSPFSK